MEIVSGMVLPWLFKHAWKFIDINTPKGVGTPSVARLLRRQGWSAWAAVLPCHCGMWTWSPSDSKQLLQDRQWHSKAQTDGLRFWVASPPGTAFRAVFIHRTWSDNSDINFIRLVKLCLPLTALQCRAAECPPERSPMTSPGKISKNSATV